MESYKTLFHRHPNIDPVNGKHIDIDSKRFNQLAKEYGVPKIKSPKTKYNIFVGGNTYKKLLKEGHQEENLSHHMVQSPTTHKYIKIGDKEYKNLINKGYYVSFTGNKDTDRLILLNLDINQLVLNNYTKSLMDNSFWCAWLDQHYHIHTNNNCKYISTLLQSPSYEEIYKIALEKDLAPLVKYLLDHHYVDIYQHYDSIWDPLVLAIRHHSWETILLLLTYNEEYIEQALYNAAESNYLNLLTYLLKTYHYDQQSLSGALSVANVKLIDILIKAGADPNSAFYSALYADDINVLKNLLTYNVTIPIDIIATALSYRYYDKLLLLVNHQTSPLPDNVKNQINNLIYNKQYKQVEAILLPYFTDLGAYYENRDKNYYKAGGEDRTLSYFSIAERENMNFF
jgi:hypothetical protein